MTVRKFRRRVAKRLKIPEMEVHKVLRGIIAEAREVLLTGEEIHLPGMCKLYIDWYYNRFKTKIEEYPSFRKEVATRFVENREYVL